MPIAYPSLSDNLRDWALRQAVFFVASAPLRGRHVNISPKGLPDSSFAVLGPNQVAYVDYTGSGCETISHIRENGRVTVLFCSFDKNPRILRFYCTGSVVETGQPEYRTWLKKMGDKDLIGARAVIVLDIFKVLISCGFGVPLLALDSDPTLDEPRPCFLNRTRLTEHSKYTVERGELSKYQQEYNLKSMDGLPALHSALRATGNSVLWAECRNWQRRNQHMIGLAQTALIVLLCAMLVLK